MKKFLLLLSLIVLGFSFITKSQICNPPCTPDPACVDTDNPGEVCPEDLPVGYQGVAYSETVTVIPPSSYQGLPLIHSIKITNVSGLPQGMTWCKSQDIFYVTNPATRYCCQLYGTPEQAGTYPLTLTIVPYLNVFGNPVAQNPVTDDTSLVVIILPPPPVANFSASSIIVNINENVSFQDLSDGNPSAWEWTFEGGNPPVSTEQNPVVFWENPGVYDVSLTVFNEGGQSTETKTDFITVIDPVRINSNLLSQIKIYPNPASSEIIIEGYNISEIKIVDVLGKEIYKANPFSDKHIIDVSKFAKANYFVKVTSDKGDIIKSISIK